MTKLINVSNKNNKIFHLIDILLILSRKIMKKLLMATMRLALLGICILVTQLTWAKLASATPEKSYEIMTPTLPFIRWPENPPIPRSGIKLQELGPQDTPALPALSKWPWSTTSPSWEEAQNNPQEYAKWLHENNKGKSVKIVKAMITAYCPCVLCCGSSADGKTRSNRTAMKPGIAVAEPVYQNARRRGNGYHVPGYFPVSYPAKPWMPDDTGSAMLDSYRDGILHIDIRYQNHAFALSKGVRYGYVFIIN